MALRCLLVSLVATLGFELPSGQDVTSWTMSGQSWVSARAGDLGSMGSATAGWLGLNNPDLVTKLVGPTLAAASSQVDAAAEARAASDSADLAFESVGEGMMLTFADDIAATRAEVAAPLPVTEVEPILVAVVEPLCEPATDALELAFPAPDAAMVAEESEQVEADESVVADRLSSAVQLTRDAVQAWTSLVQSVGSEMISTR